MASDNNLDIDSVAELEELFTEPLHDSYRLLIELDRYKTYQTSLKEAHQTKRYVLERGQLDTMNIEEANTGNPDSLREFLLWGRENYPADKAIVILWGHGHGWQGCANDYSSKDILQLYELSEALQPFTKNRPLTLMGFDMCQMATIEVLYEMSKHTRYLLASQNVEPPDGWHYAQLFKKRFDSSKMVGKRALNEFRKYYLKKGVENFTLGLFDLSHLPRLIEQLNALVALTNTDKALLNDIQESRLKSLDFKYDQYVDIGAFVEMLMAHSENPMVFDLGEELLETLEMLVLHKVSGYKYAASKGLSIYFPEALKQTDLSVYSEIKFCKTHPNWLSLLRSLKSQGDQSITVHL